MAGVVFDPSGAVVPGATVRLIGTETGDVAREFVTGEDGAFTAPLMRPSIYTVEVRRQASRSLSGPGLCCAWTINCR